MDQKIIDSILKNPSNIAQYRKQIFNYYYPNAKFINSNLVDCLFFLEFNSLNDDKKTKTIDDWIISDLDKAGPVG